MEYIGSARNVRELIFLLKEVDESATIEMKPLDDSWSYVEIWYDNATDTVVFK